MAIPKRCGMEPLNQNIEGLRTHALFLSMFSLEPEISAEARRWRSWLVHCLLKAARHYNEARNLILAQITEGKRPSAETMKGRSLPILDFALAMEDCVTSLDKVVVCINELEKKGAMSGGRVLGLETERAVLKRIRNQQEHMHVQIAAGQTGEGPIYVTVADDDDSMRFRDLSISFSALHRLVDAAYLDIAALLPGHDVNSTPDKAGMPTISMSVTITEHQPSL
jgi:hypothetical protein